MKIGIIGAGVSGLAAARLLAERHDVEVLERDSRVGGIAKVRLVEGAPYHLVGGHCLNSKNPAVMAFVHSVLPRDQWHAVRRVAKIAFRGALIDYPIEFSIAQIAVIDEDLAYRITRDFLAANERPGDNLDEWFRNQFGNALAEEYFIPYNSKIWGKAPAEMSHEWVTGKLPMPNKRQFWRGLLRQERDTMPHSEFLYPNGTSARLFEAVAAGLNVTTEYDVSRIERDRGEWVVNGERRYERVISTIPLNLLPGVIAAAPGAVTEAADRLRYNKVTNMLWETDPVEATWTYYPEASTLFHRHIHIGNFLEVPTGHTITEAMGAHSRAVMVREGEKFPYLRRPLDYNVSDHAYVVFDHRMAESVRTIRAYLDEIGLNTLGRFGEWEYYNMDVCIESAMRLASTMNRV